MIEGGSAYTKVDGARSTMHPGDFIVTPSWTFHDQGNLGDSPAIWLDGFDFRILNLLDSGFIENYPEELQPVTKAEASVPVFNFTYARSREALFRFAKNGAAHPVHGTRMQDQSPATGKSPIPTTAVFLQMLPAGFRGIPYRATDTTVYCVTEGSGRSRIGEMVFEWGVHDIFVVPSWCFVSHDADETAVLFSFSDRPAQQAIGFWREEVQGT